MSPGPTPRKQAREQSAVRIKGLALAQLAEHGTPGLSLRAIARELGLVSSALYRYFPSRDALLTALTRDACSDLAEAVTAATGTGRGRTPRRRWLDGCRAMRAWARAEPHRFALVYGPAPPGYRAPQESPTPATAVLLALLAPVAETQAPLLGGRDPVRLPAALRQQLLTAGEGLAPDSDPQRLLVMVGAFSRVVGLLTLEVNGHLVSDLEPADELVEHLLAREADDLGL